MDFAFSIIDHFRTIWGRDRYNLPGFNGSVFITSTDVSFTIGRAWTDA